MVLSPIIICLEVSENYPVSFDLHYLAEGLEISDFKPKVLASAGKENQSIEQRQFVKFTITTFMADISDKDTSSEETEQKPYFSGNPAVETTEGILHLYKVNETQTSPKSDLLCMLLVPAKMSSTDLLNFISPYRNHIQHIRIIRDPTPNIYMTLLKFESIENAHEFFNMFNGTPFNGIEPEVCHLVYVSKVESIKGGVSNLPLEGATELPTCHICLERMDESVEGILTVLCNHSFHSSCLVKWQDSTCPVCRCLQTTEISQDNKCSSCDAKENLWICLICGNIGCGR